MIDPALEAPAVTAATPRSTVTSVNVVTFSSALELMKFANPPSCFSFPGRAPETASDSLSLSKKKVSDGDGQLVGEPG